MSTAPEYEFNPQQSDVIRSLARKMWAVGLLILLIGLLHIINGAVSAYVGYRNPDKVLDAMKNHIPADKLDQVKTALGAGGMSPFVISGLAMALIGLGFLLFGWWQQQAAGSLAAVADTRGQDISRLMEAFGALNKAYGLVYNLMVIVALIVVASLLISLFTNR
jgi:hypothetical protein